MDLSVLTERRYKYWAALLPRLKKRHLVDAAREVDGPAAATQAIRDALKRQRYQTIIVVGDDTFLAGVAGTLVDRDIALGYVPFGEHTHFAERAGLALDEDDLSGKLASRRLRTFDLLQIDRAYAVDGLRFGADGRAGRRRWWSRLTWRGAPRTPVRIERAGYALEADVTGLTVSSLLSDEAAMQIVWGERRPDADPTAALPAVAATQGTTALRADRCTFRFPADPEVTIDGHPIALPARFHTRVLPRAFRLIV